MNDKDNNPKAVKEILIIHQKQDDDSYSEKFLKASLAGEKPGRKMWRKYGLSMLVVIFVSAAGFVYSKINPNEADDNISEINEYIEIELSPEKAVTIYQECNTYSHLDITADELRLALNQFFTEEEFDLYTRDDLYEYKYSNSPDKVYTTLNSYQEAYSKDRPGSARSYQINYDKVSKRVHDFEVASYDETELYELMNAVLRQLDLGVLAPDEMLEDVFEFSHQEEIFYAEYDEYELCFRAIEVNDKMHYYISVYVW